MNAGEIKISLLLEILQAKKNAGEFTVSLKQLEAEQNKVTNSAKKLETQSVSVLSIE